MRDGRMEMMRAVMLGFWVLLEEEIGGMMLMLERGEGEITLVHLGNCNEWC